jgi:hypothetical protein
MALPLISRLRTFGFLNSGAWRRPGQDTKFLVACLPKSGSTYLSMLIGNLPDFSLTTYAPAGGRREQELSETLMRKACRLPRHVVQQHVRASDYTLELIQRFDVTPIVLVRNIYDSVVSLAEHLVNESSVGPIAYFDQSLCQLPFQDRVNAIIDLAAPWYFNFYVSWWLARREAIVTYEDVILGGAKRQSEFLRSIGLATDLEEVRSAHEKTKRQFTRFNIGKAGRGANLLDPSSRKKLSRLASYYPEVDFSSIGISRNLSES